MKASQYNFIYTKDNKIILHNLISSALAELDEQDFSQFKRYSSDNNFPIDEYLKKQLIYGGYLIDDETDELQLIQAQVLEDRYSSKNLVLTVAPTSDCNFRCVYCYEKDAIHQAYMDENTQNKLIEFIQKKINKIEHFHITWYGGEPLLAIDQIYALSQRIIDLCNKKHVDYSAEIITNGYLLSKKNILTLKECNITQMQITLDGNLEVHDSRRFLKDGSGTFRVIVDNLVSQYEYMPHIALRVNIDRSNIHSCFELQKLIEEKNLQEKIYIYPGRIMSVNGCIDENNCLKMEEYAKIDFDFFSSISRNPYNYYPKRITNNCGADSAHSFVIDAHGDIYKCWDDIGYPDRKAGNLNNGVRYSKAYLEYLLMDPTKDEECRICSILPICMGGCPHQYLDNKNCSKYKYALKQSIHKFLDLFYTDIKGKD